ncbi:MAG: OmpA family protein [Spirosomaceae bacterium]|nr:OmpA family protein [Spirosomataceae bacterium]
MYKLKNFGLAMLLAVASVAQTPVKETVLQQAQRQFDSQKYANAVTLYAEALEGGSLSVQQRRQADLNVGYAYLQLGDNAKSEEAYRRAITGEPLTGGAISHYLHFAKVLGNNGKMNESQEYYDRYQAAKLAESKNAQSAQTLTKRKISYRVDYLGINTPNAEFSPMYFRDGLVYVAGKNSTSSESPEKGFLDLYYAPSPSNIKSVAVDNDGNPLGGNQSTRASRTSGMGRRLGDDAYTRPTSNDSRTVGSYDGYGLATPSTNDNASAATPNAPGPFSKELNTRFHEGPVTFSADGSQIIFTRNNFNEGQKGKSEDNNIKLKLYSANWGNGDWVNVQELPFNSDEYSTAHPSLSKDGSLLYFVSDAPKGYGGKDLYVSRWEGGRWATPINLGKEINTRSDEVFPFIDARGNLYFSSAGRKGGLGGLDLYYAILSKDGTKVIEVLHLDTPLNSKADDFGIVTDEDRSIGYFSSNRREENDDIYRFTRESSLYECRELLLRVYDNETGQSIDSTTILVRSKMAGDTTKTALQADENGWAKLCLAANNDFIFTVSKQGFLENTIGLSTRNLSEDKPTRLEMALMKPIIQELVLPDSLLAASEKPKKDTVVTLRKSHVRGVVRTETDRTPIEGVLVKLRNECTKKIYTATTDAEGRYDFEIEEGCDYTLIYAKASYGTNTVKIKKLPKKTPPKLVSNEVALLKKGDVVTLDNIYHDQGEKSLRPDAKRELDNLVMTMRKYPSLRVEIFSHTDSRGEAAANKVVSQKRAQSVVDYLASKGVARTRMKATGMGESTPVNGCVDGVICTEAEYQRNRRTEFKVLEIR